MLNREEQAKIEAAINFLSKTLQAANYNEKPVLLHSIRIAMQLYNLDYNLDVIIAALFHDLIEDSEVNLKEMEEKFGTRVVQIVQNCTMDKSIGDYVERYKKSYQMAFDDGPDSLSVHAADFIDNSYYYSKAKSKEDFNKLLTKFNYFFEMSKPKLTSTKIWLSFQQRHVELNFEQYGQ